MILAADLPRDSTRTIATVSGDVGYTGPFAFSIAFKRIHGCTPSAWRDQSRRPKADSA